MKCILPGRCVKLFGRSIHCLSRIGDELFFEALKDGLALRTVNSSRSAYACFVFSRAFFHEYDQGCEDIENSNPAEVLKCKLTMKSCLAIFKSLPTIEKTVEQCKITFQPNECRLVFTLYCRHGITKTHNLTFQECESLQAVFSKELCPNLIIAQSKVLLDTVMNFPNSCEEISMSVCPQAVKVRNFVDDEPDPTKVVHTEMTLVPEEFDNFQIGIDTQVTFCLKELRAILAFSEFVNQPLAIHFEHSGKPIVFALDNDELYEGNFVMATLSENESQTQQSQLATDATNTKQTQEKFSSQKHKSNTISNDNNLRKKKHEKLISKSPEQTVPNEEEIVCNKSKRAKISTVDNTTENIGNDFFTDSFPYKDMLKSPEHNSTQRKRQNLAKPFSQLNTSILRNNTQSKDVSKIDLTVDEENEVLMSTPPPNRTKKSVIFFGSDEKEANKTVNAVLLAADTDSEDD
ncbi:cell cycle checkpoint control protein RAD9A-like [Hydractinia symbiolongicarpus]|uniref:cell cycle checkpoint control protein RAD9A-like n=1 Tax=Hydractinia symbiolongicarpus TaxID=13093 RepID=UPI00254E57EF|nr:cell cycle checkpoint control protein RAD9A-like [Hydractinia symbiolongicarpus]